MAQLQTRFQNEIENNSFECALEYVRIMGGVFISSALVLSIQWLVPDNPSTQILAVWAMGFAFFALYMILYIVWRAHIRVTMVSQQHQQEEQEKQKQQRMYDSAETVFAQDKIYHTSANANKTMSR